MEARESVRSRITASKSRSPGTSRPSPKCAPKPNAIGPDTASLRGRCPFLCWVKDEEWRYLWGNRTICDLAGENVAGKRDSELIWKANAEALVNNDKEVLATGTRHYIHERVDHSDYGKATLSVCKWVDELNGRRLVFGISFIIPR